MKTANTANSTTTIADCTLATMLAPNTLIATIATTTAEARTFTQTPAASSPKNSDAP